MSEQKKKSKSAPKTAPVVSRKRDRNISRRKARNARRATARAKLATVRRETRAARKEVARVLGVIVTAREAERRADQGDGGPARGNLTWAVWEVARERRAAEAAA